MMCFQSQFSISIIRVYVYAEREAEETIVERESLTNPAIETEEGTLQSNHRDLNLTPSTAEAQSSANTESSRADQNDQNDQHQVKSSNCTKTRSGRISKPPERFSYGK